ncbi:MAG: hypothetical protein IPN78_03240 [Candidatus Accumulibacter sp.]|nr:hypothetical protein [Candidatus Accumulibacter propinquus]
MDASHEVALCGKQKPGETSVEPNGWHVQHPALHRNTEDRIVHASLEAMKATYHLHRQGSEPLPGLNVPPGST